MADTLYKGRTIQFFSYEEGGRWRPLAIVFTRTPGNVHTHRVVGETAYDTERAARIEAERLAKKWVDRQISLKGRDCRPEL